MDSSRLVYSTEAGNICPACQKPAAGCTCKKTKPKSPTNIKIDGILRVRREVKGRKGKTVTTVSGFQIDDTELKNLANKFGFHYIFTSAKTGENVNDSFLYMAYKLLESI